ncbi:ABC transporter permease [Salinadaptatus halalkaliphilus]|uniref:ABC transporter permease n=1 Tax=Salinadaptatus halalkaliphilus TaxID=2419781 RepID=A0A4S3TKP5_9EURY|nr:ABC transporter permease [Salinadaptatus halalkaliphilus]THE64709.1 ABC transporter permease [Salinadaptatus halalkaliphilus]
MAADESAAVDAGEQTTASTARRRRLETIFRRELRTVARTRTFLLLAAALAAVTLGVTWVGGGFTAGYLPAVVDLLTPMELLVPIVAIAFGYRAILGDEQRGELDVLETYPVSARELVVGVYAGRAVGLAATVVVALGLVGIAIAVTGDDTLRMYASHSGADSPILFARFLVLTVVFALVVLAVAIALSALVSETKSALAVAVVALVVLLIGLDLALVYGLAAGLIGDGELIHSLAVSPLSAYRGLVLETTVGVASGTGPRIASPLASLLGFAVWTGGSLAVAVWGVSR